MTQRVLDGLWRSGLWIAFALTGYFLCRVLGMPGWLAPAAAAIAAGVAGWRARQRTASFATSTPYELTAFALLLIVVLAPTVRWAFVLGGGPSPMLFLDADDAYNLSIAQGLSQSFPPPDLGYSGRTIAYHLGGPLLAEMLHRLFGLPLHDAMFAVVPLAAKLVLAGALFGAVSRLAPRVDVRTRLWAALAAGGIFLIHPYNILWNLRNTWINGEFQADTWLRGVPVVERIPDFGSAAFYGSPLAVVFVVLLFAGAGRAHWVLLGCCLFAVFLAKASLLVPTGAGWAIYAAVAWARRRDPQALFAGALGLALCLVARPYVVEPNLGQLVPGLGFGVDALGLLARGPAQALGLGPSAAALAGLAALVMATHVVAAAFARLPRSVADPQAVESWCLVGAVLLCTGLLVSFAVFEPSPEAAARFRDVHSPFASALWIPLGDYLREMGKVSIGESRFALIASFGVAGAAALVLLARSDAGRTLRLAGTAVAAAAAAAAVWHSIAATAAPLPQTTKHIDPLLEEALAAIPVQGSLIMSDDCAYDPNVQRHLPLMNAGVTALHGHHFWACNFMYGANYAAPDARSRLARFLALRDTGRLDEPTREFLRAQGVTHVLLHRRPGDDSTPNLLAANARYVVVRIVSAPGAQVAA